MTKYYGENGTKLKVGRSTPDLAYGVSGGNLQTLAKDNYSVVAGVNDTDQVFLGSIRSDAYLDYDLSKITFDDMGTSITVDIGAEATVPAIAQALNGNTIALLADNIDVATAAGTAFLLASVAANKKHLPLWKQLNLDYDPRCEIDLWLTFAGNPGTGNLNWKFVGS